MASTLMEADDSSIMSETNRIAGLESQILNSQESMARLSRELDSALLRITTLETVCSENQIDLHDKRVRIKELNDEIIEHEEINERLTQESNEKDEKLNHFNELISQLKEHIKQEEISMIELRSQIEFDQQLRELVVENSSSSSSNFNSPQDLLDQYHQNERLKFHDLLQKSLITEDISNLIDSDDILFELFTHLNSLNRLKETLSRDSQQLQHIRSLLHLPLDNPEQLIRDFLTKRECIEYLRSKIETNDQLTDFDLIKYVLHDYFNFQQQQLDIKEYLQLNAHDLNYTRLLIEHCNKTNHTIEELNERMRSHEQFNEIIAKFFDQEMSEESKLNRLQSILQSTTDSPDILSSEIPGTSDEKHFEEDHQIIIDGLTKEIDRLTEEVNYRHNQLKEITNSLESDNNDEERQLYLIRSSIDFHHALRKRFSSIDNNESILQRIDDYQSIINTFNSPENNWTDETTEQLITKLQIMKKAEDLDHEKQDAEIQTTDHDEFYLQIKELIGIEEDDSEMIINKIKELSEISQMKINEEKQLRTLLNINDENLLTSVTKLNEEYQRLAQSNSSLIVIFDQSIARLADKIGLSSDSSSQTQIDEICNLFDTFRLEYCQLTSTNIQSMNLVEIFQQIQFFHTETNQLKTLINRIDFDEPRETSDYISKLQMYLTKVETLCQLIGNDHHMNIDQALELYRQNTDVIEKISEFKEQLLTRLAVETKKQIFDRLDEIEQISTELTDKLQNSTDTLASTVSEQHNKILEYEDTLDKLRSQRERMLNKMKEMKTNNESLAIQLKEANQSIDEYHRKEINSENHLEEVEQQLRRAQDQIQVTLDDCQTQQDLQETMKLEIESLKNEIETQRKFYENRCRQILHEKKQLDKTTKEFFEEKQILEDENKQLQTLLQTIKDSFDHVDDIHSIVDGILKLRQDLSVLHQHHEQMQTENEKLLFHIDQQENTIQEYIPMKIDLEKRLINHEQQSNHFQQELKEYIERYQILQNEFHLYKEDHQTQTNSQVAVINIEQSSPPHILPLQQAVESNHWMAIDMKDEQMPLTTTHKHSTLDTPTALLNILGELKSKFGITLTHRPRSSSVFFLYLCAVHLLTLYLLFIRHC